MAVFYKEMTLKGRQVTLRNAIPDDARTLIALVNQMDEETVFLSREPGEYQMTEARQRVIIQSCIDQPNSRYLVAEIKGQIVGSSTAVFGEKKRYRHVGEINVGLLKAFWGGGIGRALLTENLSWLKQGGVERVTLEVDADNDRALSLYQSLGFVVEGRFIHERKLADGTYRDDCRMALDFTAKDGQDKP